MELAELIKHLSHSHCYPEPAEVAVVQTHISVVFLVGSFVYKIKKPVQLGFLDFSTLERRRHFCAEEVRLNRRLAADVYLGVVPVVSSDDGVRVEADGPVIEWAVKMKRLPAEATLEQRIVRGEIETGVIEKLAFKVAGFHASAESSARISSFGTFAAVAGNARENFEQTRTHIGITVSERVWRRLSELSEWWLARLQPLIDQRAERGVPRDTHGDLHLDHVYLLDEPAELVIIDCIEFNERFRHADPVADMAFLVMDLLFHRRSDLATTFADVYFQASGEGEGRTLLAFYVAYRSLVRAKVEGIVAGESEVPDATREQARRNARAHWSLALQQLEDADGRPALVLVGGLPGTGKSTLARALAERAGFRMIRSDEVRKELAGIAHDRAAAVRLDEQAYSSEWNARTYAECERRAAELLADGQRVLVDATFRAEENRQRFLKLADDLLIPALFIVCRTTPEIVRARLQQRTNDVSDADWDVYVRAAAHWQPAVESSKHLVEIDTAGATSVAAEEALRHLNERLSRSQL